MSDRSSITKQNETPKDKTCQSEMWVSRLTAPLPTPSRPPSRSHPTRTLSKISHSTRPLGTVHFYWAGARTGPTSKALATLFFPSFIYKWEVGILVPTFIMVSGKDTRGRLLHGVVVGASKSTTFPLYVGQHVWLYGWILYECGHNVRLFSISATFVLGFSCISIYLLTLVNMLFSLKSIKRGFIQDVRGKVKAQNVLSIKHVKRHVPKLPKSQENEILCGRIFLSGLYKKSWLFYKHNSYKTAMCRGRRC